MELLFQCSGNCAIRRGVRIRYRSFTYMRFVLPDYRRQSAAFEPGSVRLRRCGASGWGGERAAASVKGSARRRSESGSRPRRSAGRPVSAALGKGWACPACGDGAARSSRAGSLPAQPLEHEVGLRRARRSLDEATADDLVSGDYHLSQSKGGMSSVELARRWARASRSAWL